MQTLAGGKNLVKTMHIKYGSAEGYREHMRTIAAKGGRNSKGGGFNDRELARRAAARGGRNSRRGYRLAGTEGGVRTYINNKTGERELFFEDQAQIEN